MRGIFLLLILIISATSPALAETVMEVITINHRPASEIKPLLIPLLQSDDRVIANGSELIIRSTPERLDEIRIIIAQLDKPLTNLMITVVQGKNISADAFNAAAQIKGEYTDHGAKIKTLQLQARIRQTQSDKATNYTQNLKTLDGQPAFIKTGQLKPSQNLYIAPSRQDYFAYSTASEYREISTGFKVTPRLVGENQVILMIAPWSDQIINRRIETEEAQTTLRIKLGEWVELGSAREMHRSKLTGGLSEIRNTQAENINFLIKVERQ